jgi:hypothetical protein
MARFKLVAVGHHAKELDVCEGGPDLALWEGVRVLLGRGVRQHEGYRCGCVCVCVCVCCAAVCVLHGVRVRSACLQWGWRCQAPHGSAGQRACKVAGC